MAGAFACRASQRGHLTIVWRAPFFTGHPAPNDCHGPEEHNLRDRADAVQAHYSSSGPKKFPEGRFSEDRLHSEQILLLARSNLPRRPLRLDVVEEAPGLPQPIALAHRAPCPDATFSWSVHQEPFTLAGWTVHELGPGCSGGGITFRRVKGEPVCGPTPCGSPLRRSHCPPVEAAILTARWTGSPWTEPAARVAQVELVRHGNTPCTKGSATAHREGPLRAV